MIFSEIYGSYYKAITEILKIAVSEEGSAALKDIRPVIEKYAFAESLLAIEPAISEERWQVVRTDGQTAIENAPSRPLTLLERRWLKAISLDPRIKLFDVDFSWLDDVEPLFTPDDYYIFDKYANGRRISHMSIDPASMQVSRISLMRSTRGKNGMIYTELGSVAAQ